MNYLAAFGKPYLFFTLVPVFLVLISLRFLIVRLQGMFGQLRRRWNPPAPYDPHILEYFRNAAVFWFCCLVPSLILLYFAFYLTKYQYLGAHTENGGIAQLKKGTVFYMDQNLKEQSYPVKGNQAAAAGLFLKFPDWAQYIGLGTYHQLVSFRGNEENELHYQKIDPEDLDPYADPFFMFIFKNQKYMVIQALYMESPYFPAGAKHKILVTRNGYIIE